MFIFLDESGQFTKYNHEEYFVVGSFTVGDQRRTDKAFRSWCRSDAFPRRMRGQSEIKWSASGINDKLRLRTLKYISQLDIRIRYGFFLRKNIPNLYRKKGKIDAGSLYTNIIGEILETYLPADEKEIHIFCDQHPLKGMTKGEFKSSLRARLITKCRHDTSLQIEMIDSTSNANIQIADWISGAIARYLENGPLGQESFKILKNNFLGEGKEFFI